MSVANGCLNLKPSSRDTDCVSVVPAGRPTSGFESSTSRSSDQGDTRVVGCKVAGWACLLKRYIWGFLLPRQVGPCGLSPCGPWSVLTVRDSWFDHHNPVFAGSLSTPLRNLQAGCVPSSRSSSEIKEVYQPEGPARRACSLETLVVVRSHRSVPVVRVVIDLNPVWGLRFGRHGTSRDDSPRHLRVANTT